MPKRFCAICGRDIDDKAPHFGMCLSCYLKENPLFELPDRYSLTICLDCGSYSKKEEWVRPQINDLYKIIEEAIQKYLIKPQYKKIIDFHLEFDESSYVFSSKDLLRTCEIDIIGSLKNDSNIKHQHLIKLNLNHELCKNCSNLRGGTFYISSIQLRVKDESFFDLLKTVLDDIEKLVQKKFDNDPKQYISKIDDEKFGVDLFLSTNELMNHIISYLKNKYKFLLKRTKKLVGRDSQKGRNIYRFKSLIKFLPVHKNDAIIINDTEYIIDTITKNRVILKTKHGVKLIRDYSYFFNEKFLIIKKKEDD